MSGFTGELSQYVQAIRGRLWLVAILMIVAVGATYWRVGRVPPRYTTSAILLVRGPLFARSPSITTGPDISSGERSDTVINDISLLIDSRPIAERVARRLNLSGPEVVQQGVKAEALRGTSFMQIHGTSRNPEQAASLANVTAEEFSAYFQETNRASMAGVRRFVEEQLALSRSRLEASERALQVFRENRRIMSAAEAAGRASASVASVESELESATRLRQEADVRLAAVRERLEREAPVIVTSRATTENPAFRTIQARLVDLEIQRVQLAQQYTPQHPRLDQLTREIAEVRSRMLNEARTMVGEEVTTNNPIHDRLVGEVTTLEVDRVVLGARIEALQFTQRRRQAELMTIPSTETEFNRLARENRILETNYTALASRYQEILLRENEAGFSPASLQIIEAAVPPTVASASPFPRAGAAAALAGLVIGLFMALLLESLDDRIRGALDAEHALGVPVLAQIPTQGQQPRTAPAPAVFTIGLLLAMAVATTAVARGYVAVPAQAGDGVRSFVSTITSWMRGPGLSDSTVSRTGEGR